MVYTSSEIDTRFLYDIPDQRRKRGKQKHRKRIYKDLICAFDIETTNIPEIMQSVMYIWQMQIEDRTIIGRTWKEFLDFLEDMARRLRKNEYIVVYIFNAAFEFQFLRGVYRFQHEEVFAMDNRDVLKFDMFNHFEFRCAYHYTNMNLRSFLKQMNVPDQKTELDYSVKRWSWTPLSEKEMEYCILGQHTLTFDGPSSYQIQNGDALMRYVNAIEQACVHGLCDYIAHPDVALWTYPVMDGSVRAAAERIADISLQYNMPLELNCGSGVYRGLKEYEDGERYGYPTRAFFEVFAEKQCPVIIGMDIHDPQKFLTDLYLERALSVISDLNCNVLYDFDLVQAAEKRKREFY